MPVLFLVAQTLLYCLLLRFVQLSVGESDLWLSRRHLRPLQRIERVFRKENFPCERAGEEGIITPERVQDHNRAEGFSPVELLLANSDDRFNLRSELRVWSDFDGSALHVFHVALDLALVGLEPDVL